MWKEKFGTKQVQKSLKQAENVTNKEQLTANHSD